uniref:Uncharacterized protein n=1 Tax=Arundo donax TaxID=35708 RepID=A0A0A9AUC0_ARUDO
MVPASAVLQKPKFSQRS